MQLTRFDRWLREKFIYRTHIYTMRIPETGMPANVLVEELEDSPSRRYRFRLIANAAHDVEAILKALKQGNQMFATRIVESNPWYKKIIAPEGKSFFYRLIWMGLAMLAAAAIVFMGMRIMTNEVLKEQLMDSFRLFRDG